MDGKKIDTRILHKHDTEANWDQNALSFVPKAGELIIYDVDSENPAPRFKVGDGVHIISELPFSAATSSGGGEDTPTPIVQEIKVGVINVTRTIQPADWVQNTDTETGTTYPYYWMEAGKYYDSTLDVVEVRFGDLSVINCPYMIRTASKKLYLFVSELPTDPWNIEIILAAQYTPEEVDYPKVALTNTDVYIEPTEWTDNDDGTVSATVLNPNIFEQMRLLEWEPDDGGDFTEKADYETQDGSVIFTLQTEPTNTISGCATFGVDSAKIDVDKIQPEKVLDVNGNTGHVVVKEGTESIDNIGTLTIGTDGWESGTFTYADGESGACFTKEWECEGSATGDRFICNFASGNPAPLYFTPLDDKILIETATQPTTNVKIRGYVRKESNTSYNQYKRYETRMPIIDSGYTKTDGTTGQKQVEFNKVFSQPPQVFFSINGTSTTVIWMPKASDITTTGFLLTTCKSNNGSTDIVPAAANVNWLAVGE